MKAALTLALILPILALAEAPAPPATNEPVATNAVAAAEVRDNPQVTTASLLEQLRDLNGRLADRRQELKRKYFPQADQPGAGNRSLLDETPADLLKRLAAANLEQSGALATAQGQMASRGLRPYMNQDTLGLQQAVAQDAVSQQYRAEIKHLQLWIAARQMAERKAQASTNAIAKAAVIEASVVKFQREQAEAGNASYQFAYGQRLMKGDGVEANEPLGRAYIQRAAAQGYEPAVQSLAANR